jgi:hypothetical protein
MNMLLVVIGGVIAAVTGQLAGWQSYRLSSKRDQAAHAHELAMAQEARQKQWLKETYDELGIYLARQADWARSVHPFIGQPPAPDPMPAVDRWRIEALVANHGSPEVRALLDQWAEAARKIENAGHVITMAEQSRNPGELDQEGHRERRALDDYRKQLQETANRIHDQIKAELDG